MDKNFFGVSDNKLTDILNDFIKIASHHIKNISRNENNEITQIEWDPTWIKFRKNVKVNVRSIIIIVFIVVVLLFIYLEKEKVLIVGV